MSSQNPLQDNRFDALLALRGFACLMVLMAHCNAPRQALFFGSWDMSWLFFSAGGVAVRIFFCLSGYLMGKLFYTQKYPLTATGIINFFRNRALRVFPLYYFAILSLSVFIYPHIWQKENLVYLLRLLTFTYNQTLPVVFNGALWSLSTEVQFYLWVPLLFWLLSRRITNANHLIKFSLFLLLSTLAIRYLGWQEIISRIPTLNQQLNEFAKYYYTPVWMNLDSFLFGFLLNSFIINQNKNNLTNIWFKMLGWILIIGLYLVTSLVKYYNQPALLVIGPALSSLITCGFIFIFESGRQYQQSIKNKRLSWQVIRQKPVRLLEIFGILSYGMYVWHLPLIVAFTPMFNSPNILAYLQRLIATIITSMLLAIFSYICVEIPGSRLKWHKEKRQHKSNI